MPPVMLSKSRYLNGLQCPRLLWIASNEPDRIPEPDAATQHIFDQGHLVGELAKKLFPGGIDVPAKDFMTNIAMTKDLLRQRRPLFEAGVLSGKIYSKADILNSVNEDEWDIIEVKSSTSVKEVNLHDVSFQKLCWEDSGLKIKKCYLAYINNQYVRNGEINSEEFFILQDISDEVAIAGEGIRDRIAQMLDVISAPSCPEVTIGPHCSNPYDCPLTDCWEGLPEHNVFTLYYGGKKSHELYRSGMLSIADIPVGYKLNDKQRIQCACVVSGTPYVDKDEVKQFLADLEYPRYFLDFETFGTAIPLFDGTRAYQNIPFQFSLHIQETTGGEVRHFSFLAEGRQDPRPELIASLSRLIGSSGSVIAYNKSFEENVLVELGSAFPQYASWKANVVSRLVDLIVPFRSFYYYHPAQKGSASLKSVLPAVTGQSYEDMPIASGDDASLAFLTITFEDMPEDEVARVREELLVYCKMDTEGMVRIIKRLEEIAG
jgi:CRISPR/Cas system-associated exonuclease Cas4 (RecB family)